MNGIGPNKIERDELSKILERHKHWINQDCDGWVKMYADLRNKNLRGADIRGVDLRSADLRGACLRWADLRGADLSSANLRGADLRGTDLRGADLDTTDLNETDLRGANISGADLSGASLRGANAPFIPMACPDTGSFIAYKKAHGLIVKLLIPGDARRSSSNGRKCRCDKAVVLEIEEPDGTTANIPSVCSNYTNDFVYKVGEIVSEPDFCEDRFQECAPGIHFFINRQEAVNYGEWFKIKD